MRNDSKAKCFRRAWRENDIYDVLKSAATSFDCTALFALSNGYLEL